MRIIVTLALLFSLIGSAFTQQAKLLSKLNTSISETSGLIFINNTLITHNDSGDAPALYEVDTFSGEVTRKVIISNASHIDWEDICHDDKYIYVGDFGNNFGSRIDLCIYKISIDKFFSTENDSVNAQKISFNYIDQKSIKHNPDYTNYDTEAVMAYQDSLYIFTKNWGDNLSYIYSCPKEPGTYSLELVDIINPKGLVTGAAYNPHDHTVILSGYIFSYPILTVIKSFEGNNFSDGNIIRYFLPKNGSTQIESIAVKNQDNYFFTTEANRNGPASLYSLSDKDLNNLKIREKQILPSLKIRILNMIKRNPVFAFLWKKAMKIYFS